MKTASYAITFSFGVFMALLAAFVGSGGNNGAAAVLLGAWGAFWLMLAGGLLVARYNASDAVDHFDDDYPARHRRPHLTVGIDSETVRHLQPPVQHHVLTIRHELGQAADLATLAPAHWTVSYDQ